MELPDPGPVMELLDGFRRSQVLLCLVRLGVFDALEQDDRRPANVVQLALRLASTTGAPVSHDGLQRLLDAGAGLGLLLRSCQNGQPSYELAPIASAYLTSWAENSLVGYCRHSGSIIYPLFGSLHAAVASGHHCWREALGADATEVCVLPLRHQFLTC